MHIYVGTSGYSYAPWKGRFYPKDLKANEMLGYYAEHFSTVEINSSFYRMPSATMLAAWAARVPQAFRFSFKAPRRITHDRKLLGVEEDTNYFLQVTHSLSERGGPLLFQLPPSARCDLPRLQAFLNLLPKERMSVFEFRHASWNDPAVHELLREHRCALCLADTDEAPVDDVVSTASWGYLRLRRAEYSDAELRQWLARIRSQRWDSAYVYFKHEDEARGPDLAARLIALVDAAMENTNLVASDRSQSTAGRSDSSFAVSPRRG